MRFTTGFIIFCLFLPAWYLNAQDQSEESSPIILLDHLENDQEKIDTLLYYAGKYGDSKPQLSDSLYREVLKIASQDQFIVEQAEALTGLGIIYTYQNDYTRSDSLFREAIIRLKDRDDTDSKKTRGNVLKHKARSFFFRYQLDSAFAGFILAEEIFRELENVEDLIPILNGLGILYGEINKDYDTSIRYFNESIQLNYEIGDSLQAAKGLQNIAQVYALKKEYEKSNQLLIQSNREVLRGGDLRSLALGYNTLAGNYKLMGQLDSSAIYYQRSIAINQQIDDSFGLSEDLIGYSQVMYEMKAYRSAIASAMEVIDLTGNNKTLLQSYQLISSSYESLGDYQASLEYMKKANQVNDSIYDIEAKENISELQTKYETEKKEQEIEILSKENSIAETRQRLFLVATFLLVLIVFLILIQYRQRNTYAKVVEQKNEQLSETMASKEKLFSVIAHDLKSPLSAFSTMSSTLAENIDAFQKDQIVTYLKKFEKSSQNLSDLLNNLLQWSLSQTGSLSVKPEELDIQQLMEEAIKPLTDLADSKGIKLSIESESLRVTADHKMVETVIRNLVSNALKFTDPGGEVQVKTDPSNDLLNIRVIDTGIGMSPEEASRLFDIRQDVSKVGDHEEKGTGIGLILCKELVEKNQGKIWVESQKGVGTTFSFSLPAAA